MLGILLAPEVVVFTAALVLMIAIGAIEAIGLGASGLDAQLGIEVDDGGMLSWLGVGRVPLLVLIVAYLAAFGMLGLGGQQLALALTGHLFPALVAVPGAAVAALPAAGLLGRALGRIMPQDETTAIDVAHLTGRSGTIVVGRAVAGSPARARVLDRHGQAHHVAVEPNDPEEALEEGQEVLLVRREGSVFHVIRRDPDGFSEWISR